MHLLDDTRIRVFKMCDFRDSGVVNTYLQLLLNSEEKQHTLFSQQYFCCYLLKKTEVSEWLLASEMLRVYMLFGTGKQNLEASYKSEI